MTKGLDSIWILDSSGLCLVHRVFYRKSYMDESMFGGFLKAVLSFAEDTVEDTLEMITMGELDLYIRSFGKFYVAISVKKEYKIKEFEYKLIEVGESFRVQYKDLLETSQILDTELFEPFGDIINQIFGIKTIRVLKEHYKLLDLLKEAEKRSYSEEETVRKIIQFHENLEENKLADLLETTESILTIFKNSKTLDSDQRKKISDLIKDAKKRRGNN